MDRGYPKFLKTFMIPLYVISNLKGILRGVSNLTSDENTHIYPTRTSIFLKTPIQNLSIVLDRISQDLIYNH